MQSLLDKMTLFLKLLIWWPVFMVVPVRLGAYTLESKCRASAVQTAGFFNGRSCLYMMGFSRPGLKMMNT